MATRTIRVDQLARVEGEGALDLYISDGRVASAQLRIFEPPRLFEALLRGRSYAETPDIVARICGICPIAYQMGAVHAIEDAFGVEVGGQLRALRRLIYCGEWIESHALHVLMLHAPDFLGYPDAIAMSRDHGDRVRSGLALKKAGNDIIRVLGGREIHPVNVKAGGFYRLPTAAELAGLAESLKRASEICGRARPLGCRLSVSNIRTRLRIRRAAPPRRISVERGPARFKSRPRYRYQRLRHGVRGTPGCALDRAAFRCCAAADPISSDRLHATPLISIGCRDRSRISRARPASARSAPIRSAASSCARSKSPMPARKRLRIIAAYEPPSAASVPIEPRAGTGFGCTEAPRGICWHRYDIEADGSIATARIVPPTSQNQPSIEEDLRAGRRRDCRSAR